MIMTALNSSRANILWFLPTHGDGRYLGSAAGGREVNFNYLRQIAQAADQLGYSVGQQRMAKLHGGRRDRLEISPNLWAGVGLVRGGAGTALVGDPETVAARIREYQDLGIDTFIMSGYPHLEEAYRFAELVFPLLKLEARGNVTRLRANTGPFGETIGNEYRPKEDRPKQVSES